MNFSLSHIAAALNQASFDPTPIHNIVIDNRLVQPGDVFVAIKGETFDGFDFALSAIEKGALAVVVDRPLQASVPVFQVADTRLALGFLAKMYRASFEGLVVGITGSCGKTSTTALIASVLAQKGRTLVTEGTLNNEIGVPLTLFRLTEQDQYAVIEMGANHAKEIEYLSTLTQPHIAVITNSGPVHLEGFGSIEGVQRAKGELFESLPPNGIAVVNADDTGLAYWLLLLHGKRVVQFSLDHPADVYAQNITLNEMLQPTFDLWIQNQSLSVQLPLIGVHQVSNALAAAAVGFSLGLSITEIKAGLESTPTVAKRGIMKKGHQGLLVIDDSYNANPKAFAAAIDMLMSVPDKRQRILVMGDMGELGPEALDAHSKVGLYAKQSGVDALYTVGRLSQAASESFGAAGFHFADQASLIQALKTLAQADVCALIKGSKSSHMGIVVEELC